MSEVSTLPAETDGALAADALWPPRESPAVPTAGPAAASRLPLVVGAAVGVVLGVLIARGALPWGAAALGIGALGVILALWPQLLLHELGHLALGRLVGLRAVLVGLGRWRWERGAQGWRRYRGSAVTGLGGFALMLPPQGRLGRAALAAYALGGALANLGAALACIALLGMVPPGSWWAPLLAGAALAGALLAVINLIPFRHHGWSTDGMLVREMVLNDASGRARLATLRVLGLGYAGVRARDWPTARLPLAEVPEDPMLHSTLHAIHLAVALDTQQRPSADVHARALCRGFPELPPAVRGPVAVALGEYLALQRRDPARLAAWLPHCADGLFDLGAQRAWLRAELRCLEGDAARAREDIATARAGCVGLSDRASAQRLQQRLDALERAGGA